ncbi:thiaminase II [Metabacillus fastidiosus]|uniref:Aminopyrimidine aminohydrolase n=1 Tax=Metabacillus fastidiosus TaxID=1458 RepID=A0ABU6P2N0_9BACI|nr:thiaminase II [Metabacillus fastidiosus]MED4403613.1 thiaminase II [Metabacillus fastidiosus]MED4463660.1 thiaminase II [Metabacillus fastidiosus]
MSFSQQLREEADHIFNACYNHPFIQGIADGTLGKEQLIHYVKQDFEYLNAIMQAYAFGITKSSRREDMEMFNTSISFVLNSETHPHVNLCNVAGVKYEDLQGYPLAPTAQHYTRHMLNASQSGTLGEVIAVVLPCPYIYLDIGERLVKEVNPDTSHPFYEWITFYGVQTEEVRMYKYLKRLDELAEAATEEERKRMKEHFMISCQLEYMFFDMAYTLQNWPVQKQCTAVSN